MAEIEIVSYDGAYPNLCSGVLVFTKDGQEFTLPKYAMQSGGECYFDANWQGHVEEGSWSIDRETTQGILTDQEHAQLVRLVNQELPLGCCGGCL